MVRMSKQAMNNVVIFAMLIMIGLFNLDALFPKATAPSSRPLISADSYVLKIEQGANRLERAGQQWRQVVQQGIPSLSPEAQLAAWQQGVLSPVDAVPSVKDNAPVIVVVWLAGQTEGQVFAFFMAGEQTYVRVNGEWYLLQRVSINALLPWQING